MKNKVTVALGKKTPKALPKNTFTTLNFGTLNVVYFRETFPNQTYKIQPSAFSRVAPMQLPTLSNILLNTHGFYVPYRYVWRHWDSFINGLPVTGLSSPFAFTDCPNMSIINYWELIFSAGYVTSTIEDPNMPVDECDFIFKGDEEDIGYKLTLKGKRVYNLLISLGYNLNFIDPNNYYAFQRNTSYYAYGQQWLSLMPLLSYFKAFYDYILPSQLAESAPFRQLFNTIDNEQDPSCHFSTGFTGLLYDCLELVFNYYSSNYFTCQWMRPNSPVINDLNNFEQPIAPNRLQMQTQDVNEDYDNYSTVQNDNKRTYLDAESDIDTQGLSILQKFGKFIKRNLLSGTRAVERLASRFGVKIDDFEYGRSKYLGSQTTQLIKSNIEGTGDENLGEYAGSSFFNMKPKTFTIDCDFHGCIIFMALLKTPNMFVDGIRRHLYHTKPLDFYTPEFDGTLLQATHGHELFGRMPLSNGNIMDELNVDYGLLNDNIFGFIPRYAEYKTEIDDVTGEFALPRYGSSIDAFILPRRIFDVNSLLLDNLPNDELNIRNYLYINQGEDFQPITPMDILQASDANQFNRIFKDWLGTYDPFYTVFHFEVVVYDGSIPMDEVHELQGRGKAMYFESDGVNIN